MGRNNQMQLRQLIVDAHEIIASPLQVKQAMDELHDALADVYKALDIYEEKINAVQVTLVQNQRYVAAKLIDYLDATELPKEAN